MHTVATGKSGHLGLYRLETQITGGNGKFVSTGLKGDARAKEAIKVGFEFFRANFSQLSASEKTSENEFHLQVNEMSNTGPTEALTLSAVVALCSGMLGKPLQAQVVVLGNMTLGGVIETIENLAEAFQLAADSGATRIVLPAANVADLQTIPGELFAKFQTSFYDSPMDAVMKALGVDD